LEDADFADELKALVGEDSRQRPFVCDGSPLDCEVFIVGFNPASTMDAGFWQFWRSGYGFDKAAWFEAYRQERQAKPLAAGKTRRAAVSRTRRILELVIDAAAPVRCLETNLYSLPSKSARDLTEADRDCAVFDFLLARIKPRLIVAHGKDAQAYLQAKAPATRVIGVRHFSARGKDRPWTNEEAGLLGLEIKRVMS